MNKTKPLKLLKISGAFSFLAFRLEQVCRLFSRRAVRVSRETQAVSPFAIEPELSRGSLTRRKAWQFSDTTNGATASAQIYSLVETAKVNVQEPYTWLRHVLERLPQASSVEDYEALLPWNCSPEIPR
ncbi:transposase domain-containing protein [Pseudomonas sp. GM41(2012)]|uniref:transposase domain-containing protein n=1 Tax=Pseudomonas sp. (strain GM41(2012)) TaxID=1144708 RepID=UPI001364107B|nr:transposase domain-containing protein [Pseudomonas sp. GM41(2012)]